MNLRLPFTLALAFAFPFVSLAASHYVRAGASGNGRDWAYAYAKLPDELVRGDTYFVAAGTYPGYHFDDEESGSALINIKKATAANHGTETGWQPGYAKGPAQFGQVYFKRSYYLFDGVTGSLRSGHGFRIDVNGGGTGLTIGDPWGPRESRLSDRHHITIRHVEVVGKQVPCSNVGGAGLKMANGTNGNTHIRLSHLWLHDCAIPIQGARIKDAILEHSVMEKNASASKCHSEAWAAWGPSERVTVRNNIFSDIEGTAFIAIGKAYDWDVYNNVFMCTKDRPYSCGVGNGVIGTTDHDWETTRNWRVHHNVFINIKNARVDLMSPRGPAPSGNRVFNNIFYNNSSTGFSGVAEHDYNWFFGNGTSDQLAASEAHGQLGTGDPFVDWANGDFHLSAPTKPGKTVAFAKDPDGQARDVDGNWDRGVFEYVEGSSITIAPSPSRFNVRVHPLPSTLNVLGRRISPMGPRAAAVLLITPSGKNAGTTKALNLTPRGKK